MSRRTNHTKSNHCIRNDSVDENINNDSVNDSVDENIKKKRVSYEHKHSFQKYLHKILLSGGYLKSLDMNKITTFDSAKAVSMESIAGNESFYIGITYVGSRLCFLFCFGENQWYTIENTENPLKLMPDGMNVYIRVNDVKLVFYPDIRDKICRLANFCIVIENGFFRLDEN